VSGEEIGRTAVESMPMRGGIDKRAMLVLSAGHLSTDFGGGALPALIPFLHDRFHLTYLLSAVLILASSVSSSVIQPLFGIWSDRRGALWLLPAGVALSGVGVALAADAPRYWLVCVLVVVSGIGIAAFHPEGSKFAAYASGHRKRAGCRCSLWGATSATRSARRSPRRSSSGSVSAAACCSRSRHSRRQRGCSSSPPTFAPLRRRVAPRARMREPTSSGRWRCS
jgi:MFS family permease